MDLITVYANTNTSLLNIKKLIFILMQITKHITNVFKRYFVSLIYFLFLITNLVSQNKPHFIKQNYFSVGGGYMFNQPVVNPNNNQISKTVTSDGDFNVNWFRFFNKHVGLLLKLDFTTQSTKYQSIDTNGQRKNSEHFSFSKSGRNSLTTAITYNFLASKKINLLVACGPQFHLNRYTNPYDSSDYRFNKQNGGKVSRNTRQNGIGAYLGLMVNYKVAKQIHLFVNPSYQVGFIKFREAKIGTPSNFSILNYYGTGPSLIFGIMFCFKLPEKVIEE